MLSNKTHKNSEDCTNTMKVCKTCGDICILISEQCAWEMTPLNNATCLKDIKSALLLANCLIELILCQFGENCFSEICSAVQNESEENPLPEWVKDVLGNIHFKAMYSRAIYCYWLDEYGDGQATAGGFVAFRSDEINQATISTKAMLAKKETNDTFFNMFRDKFCKWFEGQNFPCIECKKEEKKMDCGCEINCCSCNKNIQNKYQDEDLDHYSF